VSTASSDSFPVVSISAALGLGLGLRCVRLSCVTCEQLHRGSAHAARPITKLQKQSQSAAKKSEPGPFHNQGDTPRKPQAAPATRAPSRPETPQPLNPTQTQPKPKTHPASRSAQCGPPSPPARPGSRAPRRRPTAAARRPSRRGGARRRPPRAFGG